MATTRYKPEELGATGEVDYRGRYRAKEGLVLIAFGLTDRVAIEFGIAGITARLDKAPGDSSALPPRLEESGLGDVEGQVRWRWNRESATRAGDLQLHRVRRPPSQGETADRHLRCGDQVRHRRGPRAHVGNRDRAGRDRIRGRIEPASWTSANTPSNTSGGLAADGACTPVSKARRTKCRPSASSNGTSAVTSSSRPTAGSDWPRKPPTSRRKSVSCSRFRSSRGPV